MWHRGGETTKFSRWSIFSIYTGWFVKPYFNYKKINNRKIKNLQKLLHDYSVPPQVGNKVLSLLKNLIKEDLPSSKYLNFLIQLRVVFLFLTIIQGFDEKFFCLFYLNKTS